MGIDNLPPPQFKPTSPALRSGVNPKPTMRNYTYTADLIVASLYDKTVVVKDSHEDAKKTKVIDAVCRLLSRHVFGRRLQMFAPAFEEDMKTAIQGVMDKHHIGFRM